MDRDVVAPITKLKVRSAWALSPIRDDKTSTFKFDTELTKNGDHSPDLLDRGGSCGSGGGSNIEGRRVTTPCNRESEQQTKCRCCPYGYHIDLDFVRYCESLTSGDYLRQLKQLHRSRRRQRKSIQALLGQQQQQQQQQHQEQQQRSFNHVNDGLQDHQRQQPYQLCHKRSGSVPPFLDLERIPKVVGTNPPPPDLVNNGDALTDAVLNFEEAYKSTIRKTKSHYDRAPQEPLQDSIRRVPNKLEVAPIDLLHNAPNVSMSSSSEGSFGSPGSYPPTYGGCLMLSPMMLRRSDSIGSLSTISCSTTATEAPSVCGSVVGPPPPPPSKHMAETMEALATGSLSSLREGFQSPDGGIVSPSCSSSVVSFSPVILQSIRDQMAISLNRMKELEEHAKAVPVLQVKLSVLKEEKRLLMLQLKAKAARMDQRPSEEKLKPLTENGDQSSPSRAKTRTMAVNCTVMTHSIGTGSSQPSVKSVAVDCARDLAAEKCDECELRKARRSRTTSKAVNTETPSLSIGSCDPISISPREASPCAKCQSRSLTVQRTTHADTGDLHLYAGLNAKSTATATVNVISHSASVQVVPCVRSAEAQTNLDLPKTTRDKRIGCAVDVKHCGVNANLYPAVSQRDSSCGDADVTSTTCDMCKKREPVKCKVVDLRTVGVGLHGVKDLLLCDKCNKSPGRTCNVGVNTEQLRTKTRNVGCGTSTVADLLCDRCSTLCTASASTSTVDLLPPASAPTTPTVNVCDKCSQDISRAAGNLIGAATAAATAATLPPIVESASVRRLGAAKEFRKRRPPPMEYYVSQTSYRDVGKKQSSADKAIRKDKGASSGSDSSDDEEESPDEASYDSVRGVIVHSCEDDEAIRQGRPGAVMFQPIKDAALPRGKHELSAAMRNACVLLDGHLKQQSAVSSKDLNASLNIIRHEWFRVSSQKDTDQNVVEDYLDSLESISHAVLAEVVNQCDESGNTAMHYAISYANWDVVSLLLDSKVCNVSRANKAGYTCLMLSSLANITHESYTSVLEQLFKLGDINARASQHGQTALMLAASHGKVDMVRLLLDAGADINIRDDDGSTALMCASEHGHLSVVRQLLSNVDCDPTLADNDGSTALSIAMEAGHKDVGLMIYAATSLSRGSSPYASLRLKRRCQVTTSSRRTSTPPPRTPPPHSPAWSRRSTSSIP